MNIFFEPQNWEFEEYQEIENVNNKSAGIILLAKPFSENHNSKFPYKVEAIYLTQNLRNFLNRQPVFNKQNDEVFLVLTNHKLYLTDDFIDMVKQMKVIFLCSEAYNERDRI